MNQEKYEFGWWIEIVTDQPIYIYYFGAFQKYWEAEYYKKGYIEDLEKERSRIVNIEIRKLQPKKITIPIINAPYAFSKPFLKTWKEAPFSILKKIVN